MAIGNAVRFQDGSPHPDSLHVGAYCELLIGGGTAFASAANPASEVIDGTGVTLGRVFRALGVIATGAIEVFDPGDYEVELILNDSSEQTASGNVQYDIQYAPDGATYAAFGTTDATGGGGRMQAIRLALTSKESIRLSRVQHLNANSAVRAIVTSAAGDVITITEGCLRITKIADNDPVTPGATA